MNPDSLLRYQLQVTFISESNDIFDTSERLIGCARRTGVTLIDIRINRNGAHCSGYMRIGSDRREATDLLAHRLRNLIGLDELVFDLSIEPEHATLEAFCFDSHSVDGA